MTPWSRTLCFYLCLRIYHRGCGSRQRDSMLLGDPGRVSTGCSQGTTKAITSSCGITPHMAWVSSMSIWWKILIKLVDIKGLHVGHHFVADLPDIHIAKVDVRLSSFPKGTPIPFGVSLTRLELRLRCSWWSGRSMALTCKVDITKEGREIVCKLFTLYKSDFMLGIGSFPGYQSLPL